ncbi:hypothetical protein U5801_24310 [Lamprobacter modestohalophilus]|uniref:hypothetical protein n=1 Tax=Lamprobacter modestohalophilus TaxID=1064514 RepID=UPI002ADEB138|nr:hypothetical protein [Lamprobacter modestohalophilus]MEA1052906.1 hypothetical protein [Lamprobacter modestohalophilus]
MKCLPPLKSFPPLLAVSRMARACSSKAAASLDEVACYVVIRSMIQRANACYRPSVSNHCFSTVSRWVSAEPVRSISAMMAASLF